MLSSRRIGRAVWVASALMIAYATLTPSSEKVSPHLFCFACGEFGGVDTVLNILLFVPLGIGLAMDGVNRSRAVWIMCTATVTIEFLQLVAIPGRDASFGDIAANSAGGVLGFLIGEHLDQLFFPSESLAVLLAGGWLCLWLCAQLIAGYALRASPTTSEYYGQLMRPLGDEPRYPGRILGSSFDGRPFPDWEFRDWRRARAAFASDSGGSLELLFESRAPLAQFAPVARILDAEHTELLMLGTEGSDVVFSVRTHAADLRLRVLRFRMRNGLAPATSGTSGKLDTIRVTARYAPASVALRASIKGATRSNTFRLSPSLGWRLIAPAPVDIDGSFADAVLDGGVLFGWMILAGYWIGFAYGGPARSTVGSWMPLAGAGLTALTGLLLVPPVFRLAEATWGDVAFALAGGAMGYALAIRLRTRTRLDQHECDKPGQSRPKLQ